MKQLYRLIFLLTLPIICNCSSEEELFLAFENVEYVESFPNAEILSECEEFKLDYIGVRDFEIHDTLFFISKQAGVNCISVLSSDTFNEYFSFANIGNGPGEIMYVPYFSQVTIVSESEEMFFYVNSSQKLTGYRLSPYKVLDIKDVYNGLPDFNFYAIPMSDSTVYCRGLSYDSDRQIRGIYQGEDVYANPAMEYLNDITLPHKKSGVMFNLLSSHVKYSSSASKVIEASTFSNTINIYSVKDAYQKTICFGSKMTNLNKFKNDRDLDKVIFCNIRAFPDSFGVMYVGGDDIQIQLYDYMGKPLNCFYLKHKCDCFDIDFRQGLLYTYDRDNEIFYRYDIKDILFKN